MSQAALNCHHSYNDNSHFSLFQSQFLSQNSLTTHNAIIAAVPQDTCCEQTFQTHLIQFWDVSCCNQNWIVTVLELHFNANFCVPNQQLCRGLFCLQMKQFYQGCGTMPSCHRSWAHIHTGMLDLLIVKSWLYIGWSYPIEPCCTMVLWMIATETHMEEYTLTQFKVHSSVVVTTSWNELYMNVYRPCYQENCTEIGCFWHRQLSHQQKGRQIHLEKSALGQPFRTLLDIVFLFGALRPLCISCSWEEAH